MENHVDVLQRSPIDWEFDISQFLPTVDPDEEELEKPQRTLRLITADLRETDPSWEFVKETLLAVEKRKDHFDRDNYCILEFIRL